jgi:hypothetical protein
VSYFDDVQWWKVVAEALFIDAFTHSNGLGSCHDGIGSGVGWGWSKGILKGVNGDLDIGFGICPIQKVTPTLLEI